ncbi:RagB/SusD family nutrient uptake outer membrane protein [Hymenobacter sp. BT770]|uniref:RagB/SusD family nutrient uptake outer membrane protein n=1 Tax=Hymenobacter sp. BT770 TaxID=2886942 RepID=UPI001D1116E0|nr:RagB/SusD family nutrient uptake outer membrane protein [Hymenobacter sp. BT770]MCC3152575.1 RagB/SusD family nutrient uptake outer membrane protein [Hymenobacter sp. BT770]MDO3414448.1 RagB/SusD family nutrient uptake outer membrane protein [Hymenobacter sp. BT770]
MKQSLFRLLLVAQLAAATLGLGACSDLLEPTPVQQLPDDKAITDAGSARAAAIGTYDRVQAYYQLNWPVLGFLPGENVRFNGTLNQFLQIDQNQLSADNVLITEAWTQMYQAVNGANNLIAALPGINDPLLPAAEKNQLLGEAHFLRALVYFDLGRGWGGVPLVLKPTRSKENGQGLKRSTRAQTYDQVLADLTQAETLLPDATTRNRAVKAAARALRARLHLYRQQYVEAETFATQVIGSTNYRLVTPYRAFSTAPFLSQESVFELTFSNSDANSMWNNWFPSALGGQFNFQPVPAAISQLNDPAVGGSRSALLASTVIAGATVTYGNLYSRSAQRDDPSYVLRLAEQYLIRAEARARQAKLPEAIADLNTVRTRAGVGPTTATTAEQLLLAIENERKVEFAFEADRWFDLVRTGRAGTVLGVTDQRRWVFPIPFNDLVADPDLEQNPGY